MMTRRQALRTTVLAAAAAPSLYRAAAQPAAAPAASAGGPFTLPPLPYAADALEPHIDARTMEIHHDKHHAAYVNNLNKAVAEFPEWGKKSIEDLVKDLNAVPEKIRITVRNNGGGHYNHSLFWQMMKKDGGGEPKAELAKAIDAAFGNYASFKEKFADAATKVFGSGWAWLVANTVDRKVSILSAANQDPPLTAALPDTREAELFRKRYGLARGTVTPLLGLDVWEHAYYLKYQNRRAEYIAAWFNVINWDFVADRFANLKA